MRLDDVVVGKADFRVVIDEIAGEADRLITVLRQHNGATVDLSQPAPHRTRRGRSKVGRRNRSGAHAAATTDAETPKSRRPRRVKKASRQQMSVRKQDGCPEPTRRASRRPTPPTGRMVAFAKRLAKDKRAILPSGYDNDFAICRRFLDQHAGR
jgi:DNA topoisomerase-3